MNDLKKNVLFTFKIGSGRPGPKKTSIQRIKNVQLNTGSGTVQNLLVSRPGFPEFDG